ncbi:MAG: hypothetical protein IPF99_20910 [Deltaproteobacteria bacterium]|nr:hypothetical protein [Deltaproteobacteria bacterium]
MTALETAQKTPRRVMIPVKWTLDDLAYGVGRMFSGTDLFRLWGIPEQTGPESFQMRAVTSTYGARRLFTVDRAGLSLELGARTPASTAIRVVSALQYHVNADVRTTSSLRSRCCSWPSRWPPSGDLQGDLEAPRRGEGGAHRGVRVPDSRAQALTTGMLLENTHGNELATPALHDLTRRVMSEAAAHEWRQWVKIRGAAGGRRRGGSPTRCRRSATCGFVSSRR